jgi:hypothetical protein
VLAEQNEGVKSFHASTLTIGVKDGKQEKNFEINTRQSLVVEILWRFIVLVLMKIARGFQSAQLNRGERFADQSAPT